MALGSPKALLRGSLLTPILSLLALLVVLGAVAWLSVWSQTRRLSTPGSADPRYAEGLRQTLLLQAEVKLRFTDSIPPCAVIGPLLRSGSFLVTDVRDHLDDCEECQSRIASRFSAAYSLAFYAIAPCEREASERAQPGGGGHVTEQEYRSHVSSCPNCRVAVDCAKVIAVSDYVPGCTWIQDHFRTRLCTPAECDEHLGSCPTCRARLGFTEGTG